MVYPNPASNELTISSKSHQDNTFNLRVFDVRGREVRIKLNAALPFRIDMANLEKGNYILRIEKPNTGTIASSKLIIE
jgi:hypothetical protein